MITVSILGTGNVATHLFRAFTQSPGVKVKQVYGRNEKSLLPFGKAVASTTTLSQLLPVDVYLIAVSDNAIAEVATQLPQTALVVHTSGGMTMDRLWALRPRRRAGVFYPLQTFSKEIPLAYDEIPICIEARQESDLQLLRQLATNISGNVYILDSEQRSALHLAAVFVCNFVNYLYHIGHDLAKAQQLPFDILRPLIAETARKTTHGTPKELQTGPAKRGDSQTIHQHLEQLDDVLYKKIYRLLTEGIQREKTNDPL